MTAHLGAAATAFVDGELDHGRRDEVLAHLTHCLPCRREIEGLRRVKSSLRVADPQVPQDLTSRLLAVCTVAPPPSPRRRPRVHSQARRAAVGGALVALGLGGALSLAGPAPRGPVAPVDPTSSGFLRDHVSTANEVPFTELDAVMVSATTGR